MIRMRGHYWAIVAGLIAVGIVTGTSFASVGSTGGEKVTRLRFLLNETFELQTDKAPKGPSKGDTYFLHGELLNPTTKKPVGYEGGHCLTVDSTELRAVCTVIFTPGATSAVAQAPQITAQAFFDNVEGAGAQLTAITGGTGKYAGVRGQVKASGEDPVQVVFELR